MTHGEQWDFGRNDYESTMIRQIPPSQAFPVWAVR